MAPRSGTGKCGACKDTYYCSRECQESDWPTHKLECKVPEVSPKVRKIKENLFWTRMEKQNIRMLTFYLGWREDSITSQVLYVRFDTSEEYDSWVRGKSNPLSASLQTQKDIEDYIPGLLDVKCGTVGIFYPLFW